VTDFAATPSAGDPPRVVALVCSAGGLAALTTVLSGLPATFPAAVIVLQHQRPTERSQLATILARRCALPVADARDGAALVPGSVVVVPPGRHALVTVDNRIALINSDGPPPYRPSADLLLTSLALVAGRRTIAVVLSGGGTDGATGAMAVHDFGGLVLASDRASSEHFAMPQAAIGRDDAVDHVLPVTQIAPFLCEHLSPRRAQEAS
jgi:two-component system, chemotaxis family, protein-glutamate methylesterase/glutaminase